MIKNMLFSKSPFVDKVATNRGKLYFPNILCSIPVSLTWIFVYTGLGSDTQGDEMSFVPSFLLNDLSCCANVLKTKFFQK